MTPVRILVVDDVPQVRAELCNLLRLEVDIEVAGEAANGLEAIYQSQALHPDVVLMDLEMPLMNGYEAASRIKAIFPHCRVIALTLHGDDAAREKALQAGVDIFIEKGAPLDTLVNEILLRKG